MRLALALSLNCFLGAILLTREWTPTEPARPAYEMIQENESLRMENAELHRIDREHLNDVVFLTCQNSILRSRRCSTSLGK